MKELSSSGPIGTDDGRETPRPVGRFTRSWISGVRWGGLIHRRGPLQQQTPFVTISDRFVIKEA